MKLKGRGQLRVKMALRFISSFIFPHKCPFCTERLSLSNQGTFYCAKCQTNFVEEEDEEGTSLEPSYPVSVHQASGTQRVTHFHPLLCQPCNNHQSIIFQLLSAYSDEQRGKNNNSSENWEQEYKRYKVELERRYPLCMACRVAVSERLKQQDFRLRSFTSPGRLDKNARRVVASSSRRSDYRLPELFTSLLYIGPIYFLESRKFEDVRVFILLSVAFLSSSLIFSSFIVSFLSVICITFPLYSKHLPIQVHQEFFNLHVRCIAALILIILNLLIQSVKQKPKIRVQKASTNEERFNFSLNDDEENSKLNTGRNPFFSKTLLNSSNTAVGKSMPTSPLYTNKFNAPSLKPTALSSKATSTGLENDFLESFSLSENNSNRLRNNNKAQIFQIFHLMDLFMRLGIVYVRFLAMVNTPFQALIFAAAYALFCNLDSCLHKRMPKTCRYCISLMCALRFVWLGMDIGQPGWSANFDGNLSFPREYLSFSVDAFLLVFFSPK